MGASYLKCKPSLKVEFQNVFPTTITAPKCCERFVKGQKSSLTTQMEYEKVHWIESIYFPRQISVEVDSHLTLTECKPLILRSTLTFVYQILPPRLDENFGRGRYLPTFTLPALFNRRRLPSNRALESS